LACSTHIFHSFISSFVPSIRHRCKKVFFTFLITALFTARNELRKVLFFGAVRLRFLFAYVISRESLNGFALNSRRRRVWSLARTCFKLKVKGQGHQGQKTTFSALSAAFVRLMFGNGKVFTFFLTFHLRLGGYVIVVICLSVCLSVCLSICLSVSNVAQKLSNGFALSFQGRLAMGQ